MAQRPFSRRTLLGLLSGGLALSGLRGRARADEGGPTPSEGKAAPEDGGPLFEGAPAADDPLEMLYSRRLAFEEGEPLVTVRIAEGREEITLLPRGPLSASARSQAGVMKQVLTEGSPGRWTVRLRDGKPGVGATWAELEELRFTEKENLARAVADWEARGVKTRVATVGNVYGIRGHVVDTRRHAILAEGDATEASAQRQAAALLSKYGVRPTLYRELATHPSARIELVSPAGSVVAEGFGALELRVPTGAGIEVERVEFGMGYAHNGFESRVYPGRLYATSDAQGKLALVAALGMERLVKGVVPSEIFAKAHPEALKAQAVTARGEVLAKVGARHLGDPYLLCAEQHCQVYTGLSAEKRSTDAAVDATRGEALFAHAAPGRQSTLVNSVYSAVCGGYTEDNDVVWGGPADPSLRGRPDFDPKDLGLRRYRKGIGELLVRPFVSQKVASYCQQSGLARADKIRWRRAFTLDEVNALCAPLGVPEVRKLTVQGRGISGRARALLIEGNAGSSARVAGELQIRRLFKNLNSGMFVVDKIGRTWVFTGGGWGHGSGMCQTGAIGRAQRGATYRQILAWYYSGAAPEGIY